MSQRQSPKVGFIIVGAQKAGTTALHQALSSHDQVFMPHRKELHFFDDEGVDWDRPNYECYEKHFAEKKSWQIGGEATPVYAYWPNSIERIAAYNAEMKLIFILRNPIERAYSNWVMEVSVGRERMAFSDAIREGRSRVSDDRNSYLGYHRYYSYVERGLYARQLERIFAIFPVQKVFVSLHEDMRKRPTWFLEQLALFIGVNRISDGPLRREVTSYQKGQDLGPIDPQDVMYLRTVFQDDVMRLQQMIDRDVSHWLTTNLAPGSV